MIVPAKVRKRSLEETLKRTYREHLKLLVRNVLVKSLRASVSERGNFWVDIMIVLKFNQSYF